MNLIRRALGKVVRWSLQPPATRFATRGGNVAVVPPFTANYPRRVFLGDHIYIGPYATFNSIGGVRIGDGCILGPFVHIYTANHRYEQAEALPFDEYEYLEAVDIGPNVWIGGDVVILPGVHVGEGAVIAAGALVVGDVPAGAVVGGCPAKVLKMRDLEHYRKLKAEGKVLNALVGAGRNRPRPIGRVPDEWYTQAGLPIPPHDR